MRRALAVLVERGKSLTASDGIFDLEPDHSAADPRLRRVAYLDDQDPVFWELCSQSILVDLAADLLGLDVTFRECMVNAVVRGEPARYAHHEAVRLPLPPDWSGGYTSIFADQQREARAVGHAAPVQPRA